MAGLKSDLMSFNKTRNFDNSPSEASIQNYGYYLGGTDVTNSALRQYDLMRTGYGRFFVLQSPKYVDALLPDATKKFNHLLQFANVGIDGIQGYTVDFSSITAGYAGNTIEIPTNSKDDTSSITIKLYETSNALIGSYLDFWITGVVDPYSGLAHYHGALDNPDIKAALGGVQQSNHTMEGIYVATDPSGTNVKYACLLANMFPKGSDHSHYVYEPGSHDLVQLSLEFTATKYMSPQITEIGTQLIKNYAILKNYLNFKSEYNKTGSTADGSKGLGYASGDTSKIWSADQTTTYYSGDKNMLVKK